MRDYYNKPVIGVYEKALPSYLTWKQRLEAVSTAGYDFLEISIDESDERIERLNWNSKKKTELRDAIESTGVPIMTMCLSAHRKYPIGSENEAISTKGMEIMKKAIQFSVDIGIRIIQIAGYDVYYEDSNDRTQKRFVENLKKSIEWASEAGVTLGIETIDRDFINSVSKAINIVERINSPWLQVYPDIGNMTAMNQNVVEELIKGEGHLVGVHVKDALPGIIRRVPFGKGIVPFVDAFRALHGINFKGPLLIEMWLDDAENSAEIIAKAREWVLQRWYDAFQLEAVYKKEMA